MHFRPCEKAIADTKEAYYDSLQRADQGWHEEQNDPKPFIKYMLGVILACYRDFESRVMLVHESVQDVKPNMLGLIASHNFLKRSKLKRYKICAI